MTLNEAKIKIAAESRYKTWSNIVDELEGTGDYIEYLEKAAKLLEAQLSSKQQECEELKGRLERIKNHTEGLIEPWKSELSSLQAERDELKKALHGGMYSEQKKAIAELDNEIILLQAENERLKEDATVHKNIIKSFEQGIEKRDSQIKGLRKRCEDLEAITKALLQCRIDQIESENDNPDNWHEVYRAKELLNLRQ